MKNAILRSLVCAAAITVIVGAAAADPVLDDFAVQMDGQNGFIDGGGSGWNDGDWVYYPDTGWWNQWFYNDPPDPDRWKEVFYEIVIKPMEPDPYAILEVVINCSTMEYPGGTGDPPIPPFSPGEEALFIDRSYTE